MSIDLPLIYRGEYISWKMMLQRCNNPKNSNYPYYGGRGIKVCDRWLSFKKFFKDMGERPEGMTLERKNHEGDYEPKNCIWATRKEQAHNRRDTILVTYRRKTKCLTQWAKDRKMPYTTLRTRLDRGWSFEKALLTPVKKKFSNKKKAA